MPRRSYEQYCAVSRALDVVGDHWTLLVVRELCAGPRRYTDLYANLPGISTDMLATRLRELEQDEVVRRPDGDRRGGRYDLTEAGRELLPVLESLAHWGAGRLGERRETDALRAHWFALPVGRAVAAALPRATVDIRIGDESPFHLVTGDDQAIYRDGPATLPDAEIRIDLATAAAIARGTVPLTPETPGVSWSATAC